MIKGLQKTCLVNYPPYTVSTVFMGGCNFSCPFCHNRDLVLNPGKLDTISNEEFIEFLKSRKKWLDGVCFGGGEPLLNENIVELIKKVKDLGLKVKVDTNGSNPELLKRLIDEKLIDAIAMDIKNCKEKYDETCGCSVDMAKIEEGIDLIKKSSLEYQFRSTILPKLHSKGDIQKIGEWLKGSKEFCLQNFRAGSCIDESFDNEKGFSPEEMEEFKQVLNEYFEKVLIK
jgi:pyruvate formate lyase activating enzyme